MTCTDIQDMFAYCNRQLASGCASAAGSLHRFKTCVRVAAAMLLCFTAVHLEMQSRHEQLVCFCASGRGTHREKIVWAAHPSFVAHDRIGWLGLL